MSSPAPLPLEIKLAAQRGELQKVVKWLGKGGPTDALCSATARDKAELALLHAASSGGHLDIVRELLKRGASVDLPGRFGATPLMAAAGFGHLSILFVLLQYSANPDLRCNRGYTAIMLAADEGQEECVQALLRAKANIELRNGDGRTALLLAETEGHTAITGLMRQHAAPPQPAAASPADPPDAGEPAVASPASLPVEVFESAQRGELQKVVKWLGKGGPANTLMPAASHASLLHAASSGGHLDIVRELLKQGASVSLQTNLGQTALMNAAVAGHLSILLVLIEHSANFDLQDIFGHTPLMSSALVGHEACVRALLRAKANTTLLDNDGLTALKHANIQRHTAVTALFRRHLAAASASSRPLAPQVTQATRAEQAARADTAMGELLVEEAAEQAKAHAPTKKPKRKKKAGRAIAAADEPSEARPAAAPAPPPAAVTKPTVSAAAREEAALRETIVGGELSAFEVALAAAPRQLREGGVGAEARARCDRLLEAQQETEREAKHVAAREAAAKVWLWVRSFAAAAPSPLTPAGAQRTPPAR